MKLVESKWNTVSVACLFAGLLGACGTGATNDVFSYTAVVDAGSTGSRIYLYRSTKSENFGSVQTLLSYQPSNLNGLSSFGGDPAEAGPQEIQPLLDYLSAYLSHEKLLKSQVDIGVMATGGMRGVDQATSSAIYGSVRDAIEKSGYVPGKIETISGAEEGLYSWVDINYLEGTLKARTKPVGLVEVGGASAQIAYSTSDFYNENVFNEFINGVSYKILSVSYDGLGVDSARHAMVISNSRGGGRTNNACYTSGYQFGAGPGDPKPAPGVMSLTGSYDYEICSQLFESVMNNFSVSRATKNNDFNSTKFVAVGNSVFSTLNNWGIKGQTPTSLGQDAQTYCQANTWDNFFASFGNSAPKKYLEAQCANSTYLNAFLYGQKGLSLGIEQLNTVTQINATPTTWTLGYVVISQFSH